MIPIRDLFESYLTVSNLERAMDFYGRTLGLEAARFDAELKAAFYWIGERVDSMLGLWEAGPAPLRMNLHVAFRAHLGDVLDALRLRDADIQPLDFYGHQTDQAVVLA